MPQRRTSADRAVTVFDIGGTHLRRGRWGRRDGDQVRDRSSAPAPTRLRHPEASVTELRERLVRDLCKAVPEEPDAIAGISFGAALHHGTGTVYASAPMWGPHDEPFDLHGALTARRPDVHWHIVNDVTAALTHYAASASCHGRHKILLATVSSGIACRTLDRHTRTIPVDGCGLQGEIGHLPARATVADRPIELDCECGQPGHVASFASGPGLRRMAAVQRERRPQAWERSALAEALDNGAFETDLVNALDKDDTVAEALLNDSVRPLAQVLTIALTLDPAIDRIGLTGGVATGLGEHYRRALVGQMLQIGPYLTSERTPEWITERVAVCRPGEADGLIGAGMAALDAASVRTGTAP